MICGCGCQGYACQISILSFVQGHHVFWSPVDIMWFTHMRKCAPFLGCTHSQTNYPNCVVSSSVRVFLVICNRCVLLVLSHTTPCFSTCASQTLLSSTLVYHIAGGTPRALQERLAPLQPQAQDEGRTSSVGGRVPTGGRQRFLSLGHDEQIIRSRKLHVG